MRSLVRLSIWTGCVAIVGAFAAAACNSNEAQPSNPTLIPGTDGGTPQPEAEVASSTSLAPGTPVGTPTPLANESDFVAFVEHVDAHLRAGNPGFVVERASYAEHVCRTEDLTLAVAQYPCDETGTTVQYMSVGYESQGVLLTPTEFGQWADELLRFDASASDEYGNGELRVHSYRLDEAEGAYWTVATMIYVPDEAPSYRRAITFVWELKDRAWRMTNVSDLGQPPEAEAVLTAPDRSETRYYLGAVSTLQNGSAEQGLRDEADFFGFVTWLNERLGARDASAIAERVSYTDRTCTAELVARSQAEQSGTCTLVGQMIRYVEFGTDSQGGWRSPDDVERWLAEVFDGAAVDRSDEFGGGEARVAAYRNNPEVHSTVISLIETLHTSGGDDAHRRIVLVLDWEYVGQRWQTEFIQGRSSPTGQLSVPEMMTLPERETDWRYFETANP